jgi:DNA-binding NarL/FixJ family response regulator
VALQEGQNRQQDDIPPRLLLILQLLARGFSASQVAGLLSTSEEQVEEAIRSAAVCFGTTDWRQAVAEARRRGFIL